MKDERKISVMHPGSGYTGLVAKKIGRNDLCTCGSGKKSKRCCGNRTRYFNREKSEDKNVLVDAKASTRTDRLICRKLRDVLSS